MPQNAENSRSQKGHTRSQDSNAKPRVPKPSIENSGLIFGRVKNDQPLTLDPNVGGFGQGETEIVLQNPNRVKGMIVFFFTVTVTQILLVVKKKQFEKVQAAEMNF